MDDSESEASVLNKSSRCEVLPGAYVSKDLSLMDVLTVLLRHRWLVAFSTILVTATALAYALLMQPVYRVETLLSPSIEDEAGRAAAAVSGQLGGLASLAGIDFGKEGSARDEAIAILQSRSLTKLFIEKNNLLPLLFADQWNEKDGRWATDDPEDVPTVWQALKRFDEIRTVTEDPKTGLVTLALEWSSPSTAATWVSGLVTLANEESRQRAISEAQSSLAFLERELQTTSIVGIQQVLYGFIESQTQKLTMANVREEYAFEFIDPPFAPDLDDPIKPKKPLVVGLGALLGLMLGIFFALVRNAIIARR